MGARFDGDRPREPVIPKTGDRFGQNGRYSVGSGRQGQVFHLVQFQPFDRESGVSFIAGKAQGSVGEIKTLEGGFALPQLHLANLLESTCHGVGTVGADLINPWRQRQIQHFSVIPAVDLVKAFTDQH